MADERRAERVLMVLGVLGEQRRPRRRRRRSPRPARSLEQVAGRRVVERHRRSASSRSSKPLADPVARAAAHHQDGVAGRTSRGQRIGGRLDRAGRRRPGCPGEPALTASARPAAEAIVVSGSRPAQMSAMATASAVASDVGEVVEQRGRPMVRQRLVDRPDAPARLALADGRERRADGRRVVAVVVVDDDAGRPRPCARAGDRRRGTSRGRAAMSPGGRPGRLRGAGDAERIGGVVPAGRRQADRRPCRRHRRGHAISSVVRRSVTIRPDDGRAGRPRSAGSSAASCAAPSRDHGRGAASSRSRDDRRDPRIADVRDERSHRSASAREPGDERVEDGGVVREDVGVVPFAPVRTATSGSVRVEVAGVLVGLDDEDVSAPRPAVAGVPPVSAAGSSAPTNADGIPAGCRQDVDQPARRRALAVRPRDGDQPPARRRRRR